MTTNFLKLSDRYLFNKLHITPDVEKNEERVELLIS